MEDGGWAWLLPPLIVFAVRVASDRLPLGLEALVATGFVTIVARRPPRFLLALVALLPFQQFVLAFAHRVGVPDRIVRDAGLWKEGVVAGCVAAALLTWRDGRHGIDVLDVLGLFYVGIAALYNRFPRLFVHPTGPLAVGPPTAASVVNTAFRNDTLFIVLFLAVRRLPLDRQWRDRFLVTILATAAVVAAAGLVELAFSGEWNHLVVRTLQVPTYRHDVLDSTTRNPVDIRVYSQIAGRDVLRVGSVFLDALGCGFYLVAGLAVGLERTVRRTAGPLLRLTTGMVFLTILLTQTRAAILAAVVVVIFSLRSSGARDPVTRARFALFLAAAVIVVVPLAVKTGLAARATGAVGGNDVSTQLHFERTKAGVRALTDVPLGRGLGTGATNGTRFQLAGTITSENYYLQVGNETGIVSMAVFVALVVALNVRLRRRDRSGRPTGELGWDPNDVLAAAWRGAFLGLSLSGLLLQVWLDISVAWTVWMGLAVCIGAGQPAGLPVRRDLYTPTAVRL